MKCPCESGHDLEACCGPYLDGIATPPTAQALMRSRYSAHALGRVEYLFETHAPESRDEIDRDGARAWAEQNRWLGLSILGTSAGGEDDARGEVEFVARHDPGDGPRAHHERSTFVRRQGRWYYLSGRSGRPPGRNEPCLCGSGKKFKRCCGRA